MLWHLHAHPFHNVRKAKLLSRAPSDDSPLVTWPLCPHTCQFCCFSVFPSVQRFIWGQSPPAQSVALMPDPISAVAFCLRPVASPVRGLKTGSRVLVWEAPAHRPHLSRPTAASGCSAPPCPGQHWSLPFPMTRWFRILAALQGGIKSGELNCGLRGVWSAWASEEAPLLLLKTDEKSFVVREVSGESGSTRVFQRVSSGA